MAASGSERQRDLLSFVSNALVELLGLQPADDPTYSRGMQMPMLPLLEVPSISLQRMKQILAQLSAQQQRLGTDLAYFTANATNIQSMLDRLAIICFNRQQECKQLLQREPQLLQQLVQVTAAVLQQLAAQQSTHVEVCRAAARLCDTLAWMVPMTKGRGDNPADASTPADTANLRMIRDTGGSCMAVTQQASVAVTG